MSALAKPDEIRQRNPFTMAMGRLGGAHWELVSVQHGPSVTRLVWAHGGRDTGYLEPDVIVAYFKRPVIAGRAVYEPKIEV